MQFRPGLIFLFLNLCLAITSCRSTLSKSSHAEYKKQKGFKVTASGLEYKFLHDEPGTVTIQDGNVVKMHIRTRIADSIMFDTYRWNNNEPIEQALTKEFLGAFMEGFNLLTAGDSVILRLPLEKAFKENSYPSFAKSHDMVSYDLKIFSVKTKEQDEADKKAAAIAQNIIDDQLIREYIDSNHIQAEKTASGIYYVIEKPGNGKHPLPTDKVQVHYKGYTLNKKVFDSSYERNAPVDFKLDGVIKGWTEGIPLFEEGGKGTLIIPSTLAYGLNPPPQSSIKVNDVLIFEVEILKILNQ